MFDEMPCRGDDGALIVEAPSDLETIRYTVPIAAKGKIYVAGTNSVAAFSLGAKGASPPARRR